MHWKRSKSPVQGNSATSRFLNPGIFHSDAPSLILPEGELSSWGGSCVILAPRQCGHAPFPFASHSRELVSAHPPPPSPISTPSLGSGSAFSCSCPWPLVSRSGILFLLGPKHKLFLLSGPPSTLLPSSPLYP